MQAFQELMQIVTPAQTNGTLAVTEFVAIAQGLGLTKPRDLMMRPDLIPQARAQVEAVIAANG